MSYNSIKIYLNFVTNRKMNISLYKSFFKKYKRIIIKVGSSLLVDPNLGKIRESWIKSLAKNISKQQETKYLKVIEQGV